MHVPPTSYPLLSHWLWENCWRGREKEPWEAAAARFKGMVVDQQLIAIYRGVLGVDKIVVELVDTSGNTDVYIYRQIEDTH